MKNRLSITNIAEAAPGAPLVLRGDPVSAIDEAARLGYEAVEIHVVDPGTFPTQAVAQRCRETGIRISAIVTGRIFTLRGRCLTSPDPENRAAAMEECRQYIDIAAQVNAADGVVIGWVKGNRPENDCGFDRLLAGQLRDLGIYAQVKGQKILIEVINRYETNLFNTALELKQFIEDHALPNCFIHLDTFHMNIEEADMAEAIRTAGPLLGYFHVADSNRLYPGAGHLDFASVLGALEETGYAGSISLECIPLPDGETAAREGRACLLRSVKRS